MYVLVELLSLDSKKQITSSIVNTQLKKIKIGSIIENRDNFVSEQYLVLNIIDCSFIKTIDSNYKTIRFVSTTKEIGVLNSLLAKNILSTNNILIKAFIVKYLQLTKEKNNSFKIAFNKTRVFSLQKNKVILKKFYDLEKGLKYITENQNFQSLYFSLLPINSNIQRKLSKVNELKGKLFYNIEGIFFLHNKISFNKTKYRVIYLLEEDGEGDLERINNLYSLFTLYNQYFYHQQIIRVIFSNRSFCQEVEVVKNQNQSTKAVVVFKRNTLSNKIEFNTESFEEITSLIEKGKRQLLFYPTLSFISSGKKRDYILLCKKCNNPIYCNICKDSYVELYINTNYLYGYALLCHSYDHTNYLKTLFCKICNSGNMIAFPSVLGLLKFLRSYNYPAKNKINKGDKSYIFIVSNSNVLLNKVNPKDYDSYILTHGLYLKQFSIDKKYDIKKFTQIYKNFINSYKNCRLTNQIKKILIVDSLFDDLDDANKIYTIYSKHFFTLKIVIERILSLNKLAISDLFIYKHRYNNSYYFKISCSINDLFFLNFLDRIIILNKLTDKIKIIPDMMHYNSSSNLFIRRSNELIDKSFYLIKKIAYNDLLNIFPDRNKEYND